MDARRLGRAVVPVVLVSLLGLMLAPHVGAISVTHGTTPAFTDDAPDPDVVRAGTTYYAYTTGTTWGNGIGVLTSTSPTSGWHTLSGHPWGSSAFGAGFNPSTAPAPWQAVGSSVAPGVFVRNNVWIMWYAARVAANGQDCLSVATANAPGGPFVDHTTGPVLCMPDAGGVADPHPWVDTSGVPRLYFKSNTGSSSKPARLWTVMLDSSGVRPATGAWPNPVLSQNTVLYPWEATIENPQMFFRAGTFWLVYSTGHWDSGNYAEAYATCLYPDRGCTRTTQERFLRSYSTVIGPGAATGFSDPSHNWYLAFHAWVGGTPGCTSYGCGGKRELYVQPFQVP